MASIRLGDLLVKAKVITEVQLKAALSEQQKWGGRLGEILVRMDTLTEDMLVRAISKQLNIPSVNLEQVQGVPPHVRSKIPAEVAKDLNALPLQLRDEGKTLVVAMSEPQNVKQLDTLRSVSGCKIAPQVAGRQAIARAFGRLYEGDADVSDAEGSFKMVDIQGHTIIKDQASIRRPTAPVAPPAAAPPPRQTMPSMPENLAWTGRRTAKNPVDTLREIEETQRREVAALKGMVEALIDRGVFTREEYLAKVKR